MAEPTATAVEEGPPTGEDFAALLEESLGTKKISKDR